MPYALLLGFAVSPGRLLVLPEPVIEEGVLGDLPVPVLVEVELGGLSAGLVHALTPRTLGLVRPVPPRALGLVHAHDVVVALYFSPPALAVQVARPGGVAGVSTISVFLLCSPSSQPYTRRLLWIVLLPLRPSNTLVTSWW